MLGNICQRSRKKNQKRSVFWNTKGQCISYEERSTLLKTKPNSAKRLTNKALLDIIERNDRCLMKEQFQWKGKDRSKCSGLQSQNSESQCNCSVGCVGELSGGNRGQTAKLKNEQVSGVEEGVKATHSRNCLRNTRTKLIARRSTRHVCR